MTTSAAFAIFVTYSIFGWIWESTYCSFQERQWENRGFLYGPCCPIYGVGTVLAMLLWTICSHNGIEVAWWQVFLVCAVGASALELVTSYALERLFHARWWDYSDFPLNFQGRICAPSAILFGIGGLIVVYVLYEPTTRAATAIPPNALEAISIALAAIMAADTAITVSALTRFSQAAAEVNDSVNAHMEQFVANAVGLGEAAATQLSERRDGTAQALAEARDAFDRERERFAETVRASKLANMSIVVKDAASRIIRFVSPEGDSEATFGTEREHLLGKGEDEAS